MTKSPRHNDSVAAAVHALLTGSGVEAAHVQVVGTVSTGAVRDTHLIDIDTADGMIAAVAQIRRSQIMTEQLLDVHTEAEVLRRVRAGGVPVARVLAAGLDPYPTLVTERVPGESLPRRILHQAASLPGGGDSLAAGCAEALATLHALEPGAFPDGLDRLDPAQPAAHYVERLETLLDALPHAYPVLRAGIVWLRSNVPKPPPRLALVHGDFRNGNLLVDAARLAAVVDWELAHAGDPMEDLAYLCLRCWRYGSDEYEVGGFARLDALRSRYEEAGGRWHQGRFDWWTVARTVWWGIGLAGQAAAFSAGRSNSIIHAASGRRVVELEYDLIRLLETYVQSGDPHGL